MLRISTAPTTFGLNGRNLFSAVIPGIMPDNWKPLMKRQLGLLFLLGLPACQTIAPRRLDAAETKVWSTSLSQPVTFISHGGHLLGSDNDTSITLAGNHELVLTEYGYVVWTYRGTYDILPGGSIHFTVKNGAHKWPNMELHQDARGKFLCTHRETNPDAVFRQVP